MYPKRLILDEARQMNIAALPVDVNKSDTTYRVESHKETAGIRMALSDVSGISETEATNIVRAQPYLDLTDFVRRAGASLPVTEKLVMVGAFDSIHDINTKITRRDLLLHLADINRSPAAALPGAQMTFRL
jgi:error-prone DNA polymerase